MSLSQPDKVITEEQIKAELKLQDKLDSSLKKYVKNYPYKEIGQLTHMDYAMQLMKQHVWTKICMTKDSADPMAFVKKSHNNYGVYEIYVNPYVCEASKNCMLLHEMGHVLFAHMELNMVQEEFLLSKISAYWPNLQKFFYNSQVMTPIAIRDLSQSLLNIAQDLEINGKLFTPQEWEKFQHNMQGDYINALLHSENFPLKEKMEIYKWFNTPENQRKPVFIGWHPSRFHFPVGLDYTQYVDLFLQNQELFFKQLTDAVIGSVLSVSESVNNGRTAENNNTRSKLSLDDMQRIKKQYQDTQGAQEQLTAQELTPQEAWHGNKSYSLGSKNSVNFNSSNGDSKPGVLPAEISKLEEFILHNCYSKSVQNTRNNPMYYYNRRKYNSNIMISKNTKEELYRPGNLYLLVDCSGSISYKAIEAIVLCVQRIARNLQKHSRIIWWSTELCGDYLLSNARPPEGAGGTELATGIKYIRKNYLKNSNDKLLIVSDYCDTLNEWTAELSKIKQDCIGICWSYDPILMLEKNFKFFEQDYKNEWEMNKLFDKLKTTYINIYE